MDEKVIIIQFINYQFPEIYPIDADYDGIFDYYCYRNIELELIKYPEKENLKEKRHSILNNYHSYISKNNHILSPNRLWIETNLKKFPTDEEYLFRGNDGDIIMNEKCANIFKQFNLGNNLLTPVKIFELETKKLWKNELFYVLQVCDERQYMLHKQNNPKLNYIPYPLYKKKLGLYSTVNDLQDYMIQLHSDSIQCDIDLWSDPLLRNKFFISENLYNSLKKENLIDRFCPALCEIIL